MKYLCSIALLAICQPLFAQKQCYLGSKELSSGRTSYPTIRITLAPDNAYEWNEIKAGTNGLISIKGTYELKKDKLIIDDKKTFVESVDIAENPPATFSYRGYTFKITDEKECKLKGK
jgi:hypothetical protein